MLVFLTSNGDQPWPILERSVQLFSIGANCSPRQPALDTSGIGWKKTPTRTVNPRLQS